MWLHILFGQRMQRYDGEYAPEPLECWSEYEVDENPEGFQEAIKKHQAKLGNEFDKMQVFKVRVDQDFIDCFMNGTPSMDGDIRLGE